MPSKPSIVLVHGSWVNPTFYAPFIDHLRALGYPTSCPLLPSCSPTSNAEIDLIDDALVIRGALTRLVEYEHKSVILLMHSYGGLVGSEAVPETLTASSRQKGGLLGGVSLLVYVSAFMLPPGKSCQSFYGDMPGSVVEDGFYFDPDAKSRMFADLPGEQADTWVAKMVRHPFKVQQTITTRAAWLFAPSTYVVLTEDGACPPPAQEQFAGAMGSKVVSFQAGHMAPLTKGRELADVVDQAIQARL